MKGMAHFMLKSPWIIRPWRKVATIMREAFHAHEFGAED